MKPPIDSSDIPIQTMPDISLPGSRSSIHDVPVAVRIPGYTDFHYINRGGMGEVWQATQLDPYRQVAIKVLHDSIASRHAVRRFEREIELTARLEHPNIARVYASGMHAGIYYYTMDLIDGLPLDVYIDQHKLSLHARLALMLKVTLAIEHAHARGVIHRDLKPSNILVRANGEPCVLDFGLGHALDGPEQLTRVSRDGEVLGTLAYMSPEQARGDTKNLDARADVYSIGVMIYHMVVGSYPHDMTGGMAVVTRRIAEQHAIDPREMSRQIDRDMSRLLLKSLAIDPNERYKTAAALADDIERYLNGDPLLAQPPTMIYYLSKRIHKYRGRITVAALVIAVLVLAIILSMIRVVAERNRANAASALAIANEKTSLRHAAESRQRLARLYVARGMEQVDAGDPAAGLPWLLEALRAEQDDAELAKQHRLRLAMVTQQMPTLQDVWFLPHSAHRLFRRDDGMLIGVGDEQVFEIPGDGTQTKVLATGLVSLRTDGHLALVALPRQTFALRALDGSGKSIPLPGMRDAAVAAFTHDGSVLMTVSRTTLSRWDTQSGKLLSTSELPAETIGTAFLTSGDDLLLIVQTESEADGAKARLLNATTGKSMIDTLTTADIRNVIPITEGQSVVVSAVTLQNRTHLVIQAYDDQGQMIGAETRVRSIIHVELPARSKIAYADDGAIHLIDVRTRVVRKVANITDASELRLASDATGEHLIATWQDGAVRVWDMASGTAITPRLPHESEVTGWFIDPQLKRLTTSTADGAFRQWQYDQFQPVTIDHDQRVVVSRLSPDGQYLFTGSHHSGRVWRASDGAAMSDPLVEGSQCYTGVFNAAGTTLATSHDDGTVRTWRMPDATPLKSLQVDQGVMGERRLVFFPDGDKLLIQSDGRVSVWDIAAETSLYTLDADSSWPVALSPNGKRIVSARRTQRRNIEIDLWNAANGQKIGQIPGPKHLGMLTFTKDSATIVAIGADGAAQAWRASDLSDVPAMNLNMARTTSIFNPLANPTSRSNVMAVDGNTLIIGNVHGATLSTFNDEPQTTFMLPAGVTPFVTLREAQGYAMTVDRGGIARIWSLRTGEPVTPKFNHDGIQRFIQLAPDAGRLVLSRSTNHSTIHTLSSDSRPVKDIERSQRRLLSSQITSGSLLEPLSIAEVRALWQSDSATSPDGSP